MTEEMGLKILNLLRASYPDDAYKLNDKKGDSFFVMLLEIFGRVPDNVILQAVKLTIKSCSGLPSIGDISKHVSQSRPMPKYPELPQSRRKVDTAVIDEAFRLVLDKKMELPISDKLRAFAKKHFPDIDDNTIRKNYSALSNNLKCGMKIDGNNAVMVMGKDGYIDTMVCIPKYFYYNTDGDQ